MVNDIKKYIYCYSKKDSNCLSKYGFKLQYISDGLWIHDYNEDSFNNYGNKIKNKKKFKITDSMIFGGEEVYYG